MTGAYLAQPSGAIHATDDQSISTFTHWTNTPPRCEAEIGGPEEGWRICGRPASLASRRELANGETYDLCFCTKHVDRAMHTDLPHVHILGIGRIDIIRDGR